MARDYAKNSKKKKRSGASRGKNKSSISVKLMITMVLIMGSMIAFLIYLKVDKSITSASSKTNQTAVKISKNSDSKKQIKTIPKSSSTNDETVVEDEVPFYQTHEEMVNKTVDIPIEDLRLPESKNQYEYLMPCGSFRDSSRADELKAKIAFAGFESNINKVNTKSGLWYRVELGPFKSKRKTESVRHRLQDNGMNFCKIWPKKIVK